MAYQYLSKEPGKVSCLLKLKGWDLLGLPLSAPLSKYPVVYTLPMLSISPTKVINKQIQKYLAYCFEIREPVLSLVFPQTVPMTT
jgi:hypothetical protein